MKVYDIASNLFETAEKSDMANHHGAAVVDKNNIISRGYNHSRSYIGGGSVCAVHAELHAIYQLLPYGSMKLGSDNNWYFIWDLHEEEEI